MSESGGDNNSLEEMPSVTKLLNRKKLEAGRSGNTANNAAQPSLEPQAVVEIETVAPRAAGAEGLTIDLGVSAETSAKLDSTSAGSGPAIDLAPAISAEATDSGADSSAAPAIVAPSRKRSGNTRALEVAPEQQTASATVSGPPLFTKVLVLDQLDLKSFQKAVGKHKNSTNLKKLDCLGYFASRFSEIAYFEVSEQGKLNGILGFGNPHLVVHIRSKALTAEGLPSLFEAITAGELFVGPIESLRAEDQRGFSELGFTQSAFVGAFPILRKKAVTGVWLCGGGSVEEIPQKELQVLKKFLSNLVL